MIEINNNFYRIKIHDRVYYVEHIASWDERIAKEYVDIAESLIRKHLSGSPWALLVDLRKWTLNTPGAEKILNEHFSKGIESGLSCVSTIIENSDLKKWQLNRILMKNLPQKNQTFSDISAALLWVKELGFISCVDAFKKP